MSNSPLPISNLPNVQSTGLTPNDLLIVVNYDLPSGTTKNITTDEFKTYINSGITGDYLPLSGGVMDDNAIIQFDNFSQLREGTYDFGGQGGISQICGVGFENNWQSGINHIFDSNGFIRESSHCFNIIPDNTFDSSLRFKIGSRWVLDNGDIYVCSDDSVGAAVWYLEINDTYVTGGTYFTGGTIIFDYNTGGNFPVSGLTEDLNNTIAGLAEADEETIELNLTTNKIQLKETVASATGGTRTFQGDFAISGGTLFSDVISATTYQNLPVSGLTESGNISLTNNNGNYTIAVTGITSSYWSASTGTNAIVPKNSNSVASGDNSLAEGFSTTAIGVSAFVELPTPITLFISSACTITTSDPINGHYAVVLPGDVVNEWNAYYYDCNPFTLTGGTLTSIIIDCDTYDVIYYYSATDSTYIVDTTITDSTKTNIFGNPTLSYDYLSGSAHAEGSYTVASGYTSHAEGYRTNANGNTSHAEGYLTIANGNSSHAEGYLTIANNWYSHVEGAQTTTEGLASHAEGVGTIARGGYSHAEGNSTIAGGVNSHAEGHLTTASGYTSHAEGYLTTASGNYSHTEGFFTITNGVNSHAEGFYSVASGDSSHAEGGNSLLGSTNGKGGTASGNGSHAEGLKTIANGNSSHAEGNSTIAGGEASHAEGTNTTANGNSSHAGGDSSIASGKTSFVHSTNSIVLGERSVVLGGQNITGTTSDTVYVPYLNIKYINSGTSITNLGIDSSGNVVTGITNPINSYFSAGSGSTISWNVSGTSTNYDATLTATTTLNLTNVRNGDFGTIIIRQDGVGGRTLTLGTVNGSSTTHRVANGGGGSIILTSNASAIDILTFTYNGSIMFWTVGNDYT